ncbi:MAG: biotin/lipoyl-binding protein [Lachnospiraceae bacterium]|nr:biotin/lipoyl-binding protein [Lachnospiraceae bacterium]
MDPLVDPLYIDTAGVERATVLVKRGNLAPVYQREIELSGYGEMAYRVEKDLLYKLETQYEASVDELHVEVGDRVKEGDVLLSFSSEVLEDRLSDSERTLRHAKLDIEHYRKLEDIDPLSDYRNEIGDLEDDSTLAKLYIEDVEKTYAEINVISTGEGVVSFVDPSVLDGFLKVGTPMIKVIQDDGYYTCDLDDHSELHAGEDQVDFSPGQHFIARSMFAEFEVETIEKPTGEVSGNSVDGDNIVYFKLVGVDENAIKEKKLTIYKELKEIKNVLYVEQAALIHPADTIQSFGAAPSDVNDGYYVYKMQDDGTFRVQKVVPGDLCGKYIVIKEGLEEGDVVSIPADAVESETQEQETGSASSGGGHDHNHDDDYDSFPGWGPVTVSSVPKGNK